MTTKAKTTDAPSRPGRKLLAGGRQEHAQTLPIGHSMCEAVLLRFADMGAHDIEEHALRIRRNLRPVLDRARKANKGARYGLNTGHFRTAEGDFVVVGTITRAE